MTDSKKEKLVKAYYWIIITLLSGLGVIFLGTGIWVLTIDTALTNTILLALQVLSFILFFIGFPISTVFFFIGLYLLRKNKGEKYYKKLRLTFWLNIVYVILSLIFFVSGLLYTFD